MIDQIEVKHHFIGGIYTKECALPVGFKFDQHKHKFDHMSVLASGTAVLEVDGVEVTITGPYILNIRANTVHSVTPLTPCVWLCQHVTDCTDPHDIDHELIA